MQTTSGFHNQIIQTGAEVAKNIAHDVVDLDSTAALLDANALAGNNRILRFFFRRELAVVM